MPELPEVETVRRRLLPSVEGAVVQDLRLRLDRMLEGATSSDLESLIGTTCTGLSRHGKYLLARFRDARGTVALLVIHLGMSGQLSWNPPGGEILDRFRTLPSGLRKPVGPHSIDRHTHLVLDFQGGGKLLFRDPRTFGRILFSRDPEGSDLARLARLGPDAWQVSPAIFLERWKRHRGVRTVKAVLLDQGFLAGIGNIYADEACFEAGIRPSRRSSSLSRAGIARLAQAVQEALGRGLDNCGTTFRDFVHPDGSGGANQEDLRVYARGGKPCLRCGTLLRKGVVASRGTVWCPACQS